MNRRPIGDLFDALATDYDQLRRDVGWNPWPHVAAALGDGPLGGLRVLDLGCATGEVALALSQRGARVLGVDASPQMLALARARAPQVDLLLHDLNAPLPLPDAAFDATLALGCMEFVEDLTAACEELARVTRPGGVVLYVVELCGEGLALGPRREVTLYESWTRWRRTRAEVEEDALALLDNPNFSLVYAYFEEEAQARLTYLRVLGRAPPPAGVPTPATPSTSGGGRRGR
jgi:SAM-dependent methyltransferase